VVQHLVGELQHSLATPLTGLGSANRLSTNFGVVWPFGQAGGSHSHSGIGDALTGQSVLREGGALPAFTVVWGYNNYTPLYICTPCVPTPAWWFTGWCEKTQGCIETIDAHSCDKLEWQQLDFEKGHGIAVEWCLSHVYPLRSALLFLNKVRP
jgi:hypothetical protein